MSSELVKPMPSQLLKLMSSSQFLKSKSDGNNHLLDGSPDTEGVKLDRDFMPAGQVIGSINHVLPARMIVEAVIKEARQVMQSLNSKL